MILTTEKLRKLNDEMLSLGEPVDRDYQGYNIPDFMVMSNLAYIPDDKLTPVMQYGILDNLSHYRNTQLKTIADDIDETKEYLIGRYGKDIKDYRRAIKNANLKYRPRTSSDTVLDLVKTDYAKKTVEVKHEGFSQKENAFKKANPDSVRFTYTSSGFTTSVAFDKFEEYIAMMLYRFIPSPELLDMYEDMEGFRASHEKEITDAENEAERKAREFKRVILVDNTDTYGLFRYNGYVPAVGDYIREHRADGAKWVNDGGWMAQIPFTLYEEFKTLLEKNGYNFDGVKFKECERTDIPLRKCEKKNPYPPIDLSERKLPFKPYAFQLEDIDALLESSRKLIGHDMGAGKTFISVAVGESIKEPKLVIVPESLRLNWKREIQMVNPDADVKILYSKDDYNTFRKGDWNIVGYKTATKYMRELMCEDFNCVFIDEVHNAKAVDNMGKPASKRAEAVINLALKADYCYMLTGTPMPTRSRDLYNILRMLDVKEIDFDEKWAFFNYGKTFCDGYNDGYGWVFNGNSNQEKLNKMLGNYMIRRLKKDVLPDLKKQRTFIPAEAHSKEYFRLEKKLYDPEADTDTFMGTAMSARRVLSKDKLDTVLDMAESMLEEGRSVVIVSNFNETLDMVQDKFKDDCCSIRGGMTDNAKQTAIDDFQSGKKHICALNIVAGGVGITLTKAHDMIICDYDWTPSNMSQVEDRICRAGQTECCNIQYVYCENVVVDKIFVEMITDKSAQIDKVIDNIENTMDLADGRDSFYNRLREATGHKISSPDKAHDDDMDLMFP